MPFSRKLCCPYCLHSFSPRWLLFLCTNQHCPGRKSSTAPGGQGVEHEQRGPETHNSQTFVEGRTLVPRKSRMPRTIPTEADCDECHTISHTPICPQCHALLPHDIGRVDQRMIMVIGSSASGKTHYLAALIHRLQYVTSKNFRFTMRMIGDDTRERWVNTFYMPLFVKKMLLSATHYADEAMQSQAPLVIRMTFFHDPDGQSRQARRILNIIFFDIGHSDTASLTALTSQVNYPGSADGIILLLDPLQIPSIANQLKPTPTQSRPTNTTNGTSTNATVENVVHGLRYALEQAHHLRPTQKSTIPVAFTLSKIDMLSSILEPGSGLYRPGEHDGRIDFADMQSIHTEMKGYLTHYADPQLTAFIENKFAHYKYFGVSALGEQPGNDNQLSTIRPFRVEDPFLWLLHQLKLI